jgi:GNAT superfamily N-acetyltransferase
MIRTLPLVSEPSAVTQLSAANALSAVRSYDCWRLRQYLSIGDPERGRIDSLNHATLLQFDDVGYFNRIYDFNPANIDQLETIVNLYRSTRDKRHRFGVELVARHDFDLELIRDELLAHGFNPASSTSRVGLDIQSSHWMDRQRKDLNAAGISFRQPVPAEYASVLDLYLRGFRAPIENHPGAKLNMKRLFGHPEFITWCGFHNSRPIALGMLYIKHPFAILAAGVTAPEYQNQGIHESLIQLRIQHAKSLGCSCLFSWCESDGQSYRNMTAQGFQLVRADRVWKLPSQPSSNV